MQNTNLSLLDSSGAMCLDPTMPTTQRVPREYRMCKSWGRVMHDHNTI
ncbi:hypothetical protein FQN60_001659 [Etheostoma spectabile]|uniref:Uncharacterized protein n=1 Tax=Etheostoma spectabile TaxID=54343 RepID=A0A5J5D798_9PERO|nr:hypothetical protein FQN60_001659 [Etheostoma spectabile]